MGPVSLPTATLSPSAYSQAREQAIELEGVFLNTLMKEMFASLGTDENVMGGGFAEETWRGMQAEQFADAMARGGGIGLADAIVADLLALQESTPALSMPPKAGAYK
jgi:Rod binding domain-containing protein